MSKDTKEDKIEHDSYWYLKLGLEAIKDGTDEEALGYLKNVPTILLSSVKHDSIDKMPLHCAIQKGMIKTAKMLIEEKKIQVDFYTKITYETPLILAVKKSQDEIISLLLKNGANTNHQDVWMKNASDYEPTFLSKNSSTELQNDTPQIIGDNIPASDLDANN